NCPSATVPPMTDTSTRDNRPDAWAAERAPASRLPRSHCARTQEIPPPNACHLPIWATPVKAPTSVPPIHTPSRLTAVASVDAVTDTMSTVVATRDVASLVTARHTYAGVKKHARQASCTMKPGTATAAANKVAWWSWKSRDMQAETITSATPAR